MSENKNKRDYTGLWLHCIHILFVIASFFVIARIVHIVLFYDVDERCAHRFHMNVSRKSLNPVRGSILAYDGRPLAVSSPLYQTYMDCAVHKTEYERTPDKEKEWRVEARLLADSLSAMFGDNTPEGYYRMIIREREAGHHYVKIGKPVSLTDYRRIEAFPLFKRGRNYSGVQNKVFDSRSYPYGSLARRTIGYVKDNSVNGGNDIGIESSFNKELHGKDGYMYMRTSDAGMIPDKDSSRVKSVDGLDVRTTIDIDIQDIAHNSLLKGIQEDGRIKDGCCIIMDVKTGAIRAMVNLARSSDGSIGETINIAISRAGAPGSVFKAATMMSLLEDGKVEFSDSIPTNGGKNPGFVADDHITKYERATGRKYVGLMHSFKHSYNYTFRYLVNEYYKGNEKHFIQNLSKYGLGSLLTDTEFDIEGLAKAYLPGEKDPKKEYWDATKLPSISTGYSIKETPLHILNFYNTIANGGKMMKPYLVESLESHGTVKKHFGPGVLKNSICSKSTRDSLVVALEKVIDEGTGTSLRNAKFKVAGKTGTARIEDGGLKGSYRATFVGFFPSDAPKYSAIIVTFSYPGMGTLYGASNIKLYKDIVNRIYALDTESGDAITHKGRMPKWNRNSQNETK